MTSGDRVDAASQPARDGRCQWCNGPDEAGDTVSSSRGYWWHRECAQDELIELEEALS